MTACRRGHSPRSRFGEFTTTGSRVTVRGRRDDRADSDAAPLDGRSLHHKSQQPLPLRERHRVEALRDLTAEPTKIVCRRPALVVLPLPRVDLAPGQLQLRTKLPQPLHLALVAVQVHGLIAVGAPVIRSSWALARLRARVIGFRFASRPSGVAVCSSRRSCSWTGRSGAPVASASVPHRSQSDATSRPGSGRQVERRAAGPGGVLHLQGRGRRRGAVEAGLQRIGAPHGPGLSSVGTRGYPCRRAASSPLAGQTCHYWGQVTCAIWWAAGCVRGALYRGPTSRLVGRLLPTSARATVLRLRARLPLPESGNAKCLRVGTRPNPTPHRPAQLLRASHSPCRSRP